MSNLWSEVFAFLMINKFYIASFIVVIVLRLVQIKGSQKDIQYATIALATIQSFLGVALGEKATIVFKVWAEALTAINNGGFSNEQMIDEFVKIIKTAMDKQNVVLTAQELTDVRSAATVTLQMSQVKTKSTQKAVEILSIKN